MTTTDARKRFEEAQRLAALAAHAEPTSTHDVATDWPCGHVDTYLDHHACGICGTCAHTVCDNCGTIVGNCAPALAQTA